MNTMKAGWNQIRNQTPVEIPQGFITEAITFEQEASSVSIQGEGKDFQKLIELNQKLESLVTQFTSQIYQIQEKVQSIEDDDDHPADLTHEIYRLIDINLRYYRSKEISEYVEQGIQQDSPSGAGNPPRSIVAKFKQSQIKLLNIIKDSLREANKKYSRLDEQEMDLQDKEVAYLYQLASEFESRIRYFGQYSRQRNGDTEVIDFFQMMKGSSNEIDVEEQMEDIAEEKKELSDMIDEADQELEEI